MEACTLCMGMTFTPLNSCLHTLLLICSVNERGLYDYLIINDNLEAAVAQLREVAHRAVLGLDPEPGKVPESVLIEDVSGQVLVKLAGDGRCSLKA